MATGKVRVDASQKVRNDHEMFLEAYERPTQIYRFLKARHSLEPLFLQRNLSYMKSRRRKNKRKKVSLAKIIEQVDEVQQQLHHENAALSQEIKSDNHLNLSIERVSLGEDFMKLEKVDSEADEPFKHGTMLEVELLLYRFNHPTPEALITSNRSSLSCQCTSLGHCIIPYSSSSSDLSPTETKPTTPATISIPGSMLSWRKRNNGSLGTHMLTFKVSPASIIKPSTADITVNEDHQDDEKATKRKRLGLNLRKKRSPSVSTEHQNGITNNHLSSLPNGITDKPISKTRKRNPRGLVDNNHSTNIQKSTENSVTSNLCTDSVKRLRKKAPGGKTLPTVSEKTTDKLNVSISRKSLLKMSSTKQRLRHNSTRSSAEKNSIYEEEELSSSSSSEDDEEFTNVSSINLTNRSSVRNLRKRNFTDEDNVGSELSQAKRPCNSVKSVDTIEASDDPLNMAANTDQVYCAELVVFDSRQECLLDNGEYELLMHNTSTTNPELVEEGDDTVTESNNTVFTFNEEAFKLNKTLTIKFTTKWTPDPPKPRNQELAQTAFELIKLRKSYAGVIPAASDESFPNPPLRTQPRCPTPCPVNPTLFNFMYNNDRLQQTELKENFTCPWCSLDCKQLYCLLKHMSLCHPRFKFIYNQSDKGISCVDVKLNKHYDTKLSSTDPVEMMGRDAISVRKKPTKLTPMTSVLVNKYDACESFSLNEFTPRWQLQSTELFRTFYHSQTCLPMLPGEEEDSEIESSSNSEWLKTTSMQMLDEFIDVNFGEKLFMKIWNSYIMDHGILADKQVPKLCVDFARDKSDELREKNIILNFMSHVIYLCDIGLVPSSTIQQVHNLVSLPSLPDSSSAVSQ